jgi:hypothetical protein
VTFHYRPPHLLVASVLSVGSVLVLLALFVGWLVVRRRRPKGPPDGPGAGAVAAAPLSEDQSGPGDQRGDDPSSLDAEGKVPAPSVLERGVP